MACAPLASIAVARRLLKCWAVQKTVPWRKLRARCPQAHTSRSRAAARAPYAHADTPLVCNSDFPVHRTGPPIQTTNRWAVVRRRPTFYSPRSPGMTPELPPTSFFKHARRWGSCAESRHESSGPLYSRFVFVQQLPHRQPHGLRSTALPTGPLRDNDIGGHQGAPSTRIAQKCGKQPALNHAMGAFGETQDDVGSRTDHLIALTQGCRRSRDVASGSVGALQLLRYRSTSLGKSSDVHAQQPEGLSRAWQRSSKTHGVPQSIWTLESARVDRETETRPT